MAADTPPELRQVLQGLALNRIPGWNFPGNFLDLSFDEVGPDSARLSLEPGAHAVDANGEVNLGALAVLADIGMAAGMRHQVGMDTRMATVGMSVQLTGAPRVGRLEAFGRFDGFLQGAAGRQGLSRAEIRADGVLVATSTGSFMALGNREGMPPLPMRRRGVDPEARPLAAAELSEDERAVYERARTALQPDGRTSFVERFWGLLPRATDDGAQCDFANGLHVGNRVGHTQGGITFALAAVTGMAAVGAEWRLAAVSAWYVSPGTGARLRAVANVVHEGRLTAVTRARIIDEEGRTVLEAMTSHSRADRHSREGGNPAATA